MEGTLDYYWRKYAAAACIIGVTTALVYPLDLIHTRMSTDMTSKKETRLFQTTFDCFNRTHIDEGFRTGLYKGWQLSFASSFIRSAITLPMLGALKPVVPDSDNAWLQSFKQKLGLSFAASTVISLLLYPLDTAKRCMQLNGARGHLNPYKTSIECLRSLVGTHGVVGLYRGVHLYVLRETMTALAHLQIYESLFSSVTNISTK